ncbi:MAG: M56 family metallopeptidase [Gemmatimonadaceae bacterium]
MNATIFGYVVLFTALLAGAAAAVEWGMQGRMATRQLWTVAIALAVLAPPAVLAWNARAQTSEGGQSEAIGISTAHLTSAVNSGRTVVRRTGAFPAWMTSILSSLSARVKATVTASRLNRRLLAVLLGSWALLSLLIVTWLTAGIFHWRRAQRLWQRTTLDGVDVDVSPFTGPAVLGFLTHRIVVPAWATTMQPEHRQLVLAHECEHIKARDPERLLVAIVALALMPWNLGLWWCAARLRRAIELDCDSRVLRRFPNPKLYGNVLLDVAARGRKTGLIAIPMVGLLHPASQLELRLRAMTRTRQAGYRSAIIGGLAATVAVSAAFTAPVPSFPLRKATAALMTRRSGLAPALIDRSIAGDTVPKVRTDSMIALLQRRDSLRTIAREIATRTRELNRARSKLDSTSATLRAQRTELDVQQTRLSLLQSRMPLEPTLDSTSATLRVQRTERDIQQTRLSLLQSRMPVDPNRTYFAYQVTTPASIRPGSPTPRYPDALRSKHVEGEVHATFVVDATGRVEQGSIRVTRATNQLFADAVRAALPQMQFAPAAIRGIHVKQLVELPFTFATAGSSK